MSAALFDAMARATGGVPGRYVQPQPVVIAVTA
jgi:hypothetical protein